MTREEILEYIAFRASGVNQSKEYTLEQFHREMVQLTRNEENETRKIKEGYNHFVTLGQRHTHRVNGKTVDCDTVVVYKAKNKKEGREKAFMYFADQFFTDYHAEEWKEKELEYFPKGYTYIE